MYAILLSVSLCFNAGFNVILKVTYLSQLLLPKYTSGLYPGFRQFSVKPAYRFALLSEALEGVPRGPTNCVVLASLTTMIIDIGASVCPGMRDQTLKQSLSDLHEVVHDFASDRDDLRVSSSVCKNFPLVPLWPFLYG
jgi:hypothetical protein